MRVLIVAEDLYRSVGGGQTYYRKLIESHPDIAFCYFRRYESDKAQRPDNTETFQVKGRPAVNISAPVFLPPAHRDALAAALTYARAVSGERFDLVDFPDFHTFGSLIRPAMRSFDSDAGAIVLSLHGSISHSVKLGWEGDPGTMDLEDLEDRQFTSAEARYAISPTYAREWRSRIELPVTVLDPRSILTRPATCASPLSPSSPPDLLLVGRRERRKGDDIALDILSWIPASRFRKIVLVGDNVSYDGGNSDEHLKEIAERRGLAVEFRAAIPHADLVALYSGNVALICATRQDSLNLVVLEAAAAGCPIAVSSRAGAASFLTSLPQPHPCLVFDIDQRANAIMAIDTWLSRFSEERRLARRAADLLLAGTPELDLRPVYKSAIESPRRPEAPIVWHSRPPLFRPFTAKAASAVATARAQDKLASLRPIARKAVRAAQRVRRLGHVGLQSVLYSDAAALVSRSNTLPERTEAQIEQKLALLRTSNGQAPMRINFWLEAARLERLVGRDLTAAAYELRALRLLGPSAPASVDKVQVALKRNGLSHVAPVVHVESDSQSFDLARLLDERRTRLEKRPSFASETLAQRLERRSAATPKVSVIVSVYQAARHLPLFLQLLQRQTIPSDCFELIVVDAASPDEPLELILANAGPMSGNLLYLRTRRRETIQAAWNRGLLCARGEYVAFLGVDEALFPTALEKLSTMLDNDRTIDWAMGSSLVTAVNPIGVHETDKMFYDRRGARRDLALLDTTYVSWVGGLYRKSVHDRIGWYDADFRAAGDTEFKMRVLGSLKIGFTDETLGLFLDYPTNRTTSSALAEVEDALAWYAYRTPAGAAYLARDRSEDDLWNLLRYCAGYRKCFRTAKSTDIDFGVAIASVLAGRGSPTAMILLEDFKIMRDALRSREHAASRRDLSYSRRVETRVRRIFASFRLRHAELLELSTEPPYYVTNDNRFEQHSWLW